MNYYLFTMMDHTILGLLLLRSRSSKYIVADKKQEIFVVLLQKVTHLPTTGKKNEGFFNIIAVGVVSIRYYFSETKTLR